MWRFLMRAFRGWRGAKSWDATMTAPIELARNLRTDPKYSQRRYALELRQQKAIEEHRSLVEEQERAWQAERERRWQEMTAEERQEGARVLEVRAWRKNG